VGDSISAFLLLNKVSSRVLLVFESDIQIID